VLRTGVRTFQAAAFLKSRGADTVEVKRMFSNSIDEYKTRYEIVSQAEIFNSCAVASTDEGNGDIKIVAAQAADELLGILGVKASFVLYPMEDGTSISARSFGVINVQLIMEKIGGGGHQTMAGAQLKGVPMADAREKLIEIVRCIEIKDI
jgi:c-di-AMP phosphodiesterase-like protein